MRTDLIDLHRLRAGAERRLFEAPLRLRIRLHRQLTPALYDALERRALSEVSVPLSMAFRPVTYRQVGYPDHVSHVRELIRYVDHNFETEVAGLFRSGASFPPAAYVNRFSADERDLLASVRASVAKLTWRCFRRTVRPVSNLLVQIGPYRIIQELSRAAGRRALKVFEAGPGLGYLGALLALSGHGYVSFDVTQSVYLWQSCLLQEVAGDFEEAAFDLRSDRLPSARVVHVPWWKYTALLGCLPLTADVVYSNSNLCEMSLLALQMLLENARRLLAGSDVGLFVFLSTGMPAQTTAAALHEQFELFGFHRVLESPFIAYAHGTRDVAPLLEGFKQGIPLFAPSGRGETFEAHQVVPVRRSEAPLDVHLAQWNHGWVPPYSD